MNNREAKIKRRVAHVIGGIAFAVVFAIFAYLSCSVAVHSSDFAGMDPNKDVDAAYGYNREAYLQKHGYDWGSPDMTWFYKLHFAGMPEPAQAASEEAAEPEAQAAAEPAAPEATPAPTLNPAAIKAQEKGLPAPPEIDKNDWKYMLINAAHPLDASYAPPEMAYLSQTAAETDIQHDFNANRCPVDSRIAEPLLNFALGCKNAGLPVFLSSGYRSYDEQSYLLNRKISQGYSEEVAKTIVAYPGTSEHQSALCCDITDYYRQLKDSSLAETDTYRWLKDNCADYGFVVRYPEDKSGSADSVTGVIYEPWHFRYVGEEAAHYMTDNNLCLEEFLELYE